MAVNCRECGFRYIENDKDVCYQTKKEINNPTPDGCRTYMATKYDGDEPFTPAQHMFLFEDEQMKKGMTSMQGLRFK